MHLDLLPANLLQSLLYATLGLVRRRRPAVPVPAPARRRATPAAPRRAPAL